MKPEMPFTVEEWRAMSREQQRELLFDPSNSEFFDWLANEVLEPLLLTGHSEHTRNLTVPKEVDAWFAPLWRNCWVR